MSINNTKYLMVNNYYCIYFRGLAGKYSDPFRVWCSRIGELRSFLESVPLIALTASSKMSTRKTIIDMLAMNNCIEIIANPDRRNIKLHVKEIKNDITSNFSWLVEMLKEKQTDSERVVIYCQSIRQCTAFYNFFKMELGQSLYCPGKPKLAGYRLIAMYHSSTDPDIKNIVTNSLSDPKGYIRVVIATSALGMGVDIKGLHIVINYGPPNCIVSYYQAFGRAGRDGEQSHAVLLYHGTQLRKCDSDMLRYLKHNGCRRELLLNFFDTTSSINYIPVTPNHCCCDNCACNCQDPKCKDFDSPVLETCKTDTESPIMRVERSVTEEQKKEVSKLLLQKREDLFKNYQGVSFCSSLDLITTFSLKLLDEVTSKCSYLFSIDDILNYTSVYCCEHARLISECLSEIFTDMDVDDEEFSNIEL
jgi:superfamily II DNA helicase RecQ